MWCVLCCLVLKAPASSAVPGTGVAWHVCKHTSTGPVSTHPAARRHLRTKTRAELRRPPEGRGHPLHTRVMFVGCGGKTRSQVLRLVTEYLLLLCFSAGLVSDVTLCLIMGYSLRNGFEAVQDFAVCMGSCTYRPPRHTT